MRREAHKLTLFHAELESFDHIANLLPMAIDVTSGTSYEAPRSIFDHEDGEDQDDTASGDAACISAYLTISVLRHTLQEDRKRSSVKLSYLNYINAAHPVAELLYDSRQHILAAATLWSQRLFRLLHDIICGFLARQEAAH